MTDDPVDEHHVPPPEPEHVRDLVTQDQAHQCDRPTLSPGSEWTCPECGQDWVAERDGVRRENNK